MSPKMPSVRPPSLPRSTSANVDGARGMVHSHSPYSRSREQRHTLGRPHIFALRNERSGLRSGLALQRARRIGGSSAIPGADLRAPVDRPRVSSRSSSGAARTSRARTARVSPEGRRCTIRTGQARPRQEPSPRGNASTWAPFGVPSSLHEPNRPCVGYRLLTAVK
jgi:hypothetical protein